MQNKKIDKQQLIEKINKEILIYELVQEYNVSLKPVGKNFMGLCPFHKEKTPSFAVSPEKNIAVCMSCKKGGKPISFYKEIENITFDKAIFLLSQKLNIDNNTLSMKFLLDPKQKFYKILKDAKDFFQHQLIKDQRGEKVLSYLKKRHIHDATIKYFQLGYAFSFEEEKKSKISYLFDWLQNEKKYSIDDLIDLGLMKENIDTGKYYNFFNGRLIFPITNIKGNIIGFCGRNLDSKENFKYLFNSNNKIFDKQKILYQYYENKNDIKAKDQVIIYEGFFDIMVSFQSGIKNAVATLGTNFSDFNIQELSKLTKNFVFAYDNDEAGQKSFLRIGNYLNSKGYFIKRILFPKGMDPADYYCYEGIEKFKIFMENNIEDFLEIQIDSIMQKKGLMPIELIKQKIFILFQYHDDKVRIYYQTMIYQKYKIIIDLSVSNKFYNNFVYNNIYNDNNKLFRYIINYKASVINENNSWEKILLKLQNNYLMDKSDFFYPLMKKIKEYYDLNPQMNSIIPSEFYLIYNNFVLSFPKSKLFLIWLQKNIKNEYIKKKENIIEERNYIRNKLLLEKDKDQQNEFLKKLKELQQELMEIENLSKESIMKY